MLIFDAHLDLSLNALTYNRDLRMSIADIRSNERGLNDLGGRGHGTVCFPELRAAGVGICVATQLAGCMKPAAAGGGWNSPEQAWAMTQGQLAWYRAMETDGQLLSIRNRSDLRSHLAAWADDPVNTPIGYVLSLEGADSIRTLDDLPAAYEQGLRAIGPAHYGVGRYALGHDQSGPLSIQGRELIRQMDQLGIILDVTHLCEETFWDALDCFQGTVWASHHNCRALVDDPRQLSDQQIQALAERDAVIGIAFDIWMGVPNWMRGQTSHDNRPGADLAALANHVDHVCQLLGTTQHVGIGTDLDGGYGTEQTPADLDTIADLNQFIAILRRRGYSDDDLQGISHGNFIRLLDRTWD
ncbi:membrane dipeptidase [Stieleria sp. TO1_6]|uniref:dipeptidase n=1 Tax=Stieleria tagensis TaxID=2956795 RepID=UPI00209AF37A|nr:membrane dipeptidase [Stieleria tagensis]MCO8124036.1 membrane dipeptidase [Stieleria tagensis]